MILGQLLTLRQNNSWHAAAVALPLLMLGVCVFASPAQAGFQWITPVENQNDVQLSEPLLPPPALRPQLNPVKRPLDIPPTIIEARPLPPVAEARPRLVAPAPAVPPAAPVALGIPSAGIPAAGMSSPDAAPLTPVALAPAGMGSDVLNGFADQVPLTIALQQVLPSGVSYRLESGAEPGTLVSWQGGQSWQRVLDSMLSSVGLTGRMEGSQLVVSPGAISAVSDMGGPMPVGVLGSPASLLVPAAFSGGAIGGAVPNADAALRLGPASWSVVPGRMLRETLEEWSQQAGIELYWAAEYDYPIKASAQFVGTFEEAVRNLLSGFESARPQPVGRMHLNPSLGQSLLIVESRGNDYGN